MTGLLSKGRGRRTIWIKAKKQTHMSPDLGKEHYIQPLIPEDTHVLEVPVSDLRKKIDSLAAINDSESDLEFDILANHVITREELLDAPKRAARKDILKMASMMSAAVAQIDEHGNYNLDGDEFNRLSATILGEYYDDSTLDILIEQFSKFESRNVTDRDGDKIFFMAFIEKAPRDILSSLYNSPDSNLRAYLSRKPESKEDAARMLRILKRTQENGDDENSEECMAIREVLNDPVEFMIEAIPSFPDTHKLEDIDAYRHEVQQSVREICRQSGLNMRIAEAYLKNATIRQSGWRGDGKTISGSFNGYKVRKHMKHIVETARVITPAMMDEVMSEFKIETLEPYTAASISLLHKLNLRDPMTLEHLQDGDVSVVFFDARGDHNGAFSDSISGMQKATGRTILLEFSHPSDIMVRMEWLRSLGIKPATVAIGAHGVPGAIQVNREDEAMIILSPRKPGWYNLSTRQSSIYSLNLAEIMTDRYTQTIRDDDYKKGRKELLIISCSSDKKDEAIQHTYAEAVTRSMGSKVVDVTAATDNAYFGTDSEGRMYMQEDVDKATPWYKSSPTRTNMVRLRGRVGRSDGLYKVRRRLHVPAYNVNARTKDSEKKYA